MKININNTKKLNDMIQKAEGNRVSARCISVPDVIYEITTIERKLKHLIYKKDWKGLKFDIDPHGQSFPASYMGVPESTQVRIERFSSGWFVVNIERGRCNSMSIYPVNMKSKSEEMVEFVSNNANWQE